jgi:hypothetical protein
MAYSNETFMAGSREADGFSRFSHNVSLVCVHVCVRVCPEPTAGINIVDIN